MKQGSVGLVVGEGTGLAVGEPVGAIVVGPELGETVGALLGESVSGIQDLGPSTHKGASRTPSESSRNKTHSSALFPDTLNEKKRHSAF